MASLASIRGRSSSVCLPRSITTVVAVSGDWSWWPPTILPLANILPHHSTTFSIDFSRSASLPFANHSPWVINSMYFMSLAPFPCPGPYFHLCRRVGGRQKGHYGWIRGGDRLAAWAYGRRQDRGAPRRMALIDWLEASSGDSAITVAGRSKRRSAFASGSARSVP